MLIKEFAERTGWTRDTIRFYERLGLLRPVRSRGNGYRHYTEAEVELAEQVKMAQALGFSLAEIKRGVGAHRSGSLTPAYEDAMIEQKLAEDDLVARFEFLHISTILAAATQGHGPTLDNCELGLRA